MGKKSKKTKKGKKSKKDDSSSDDDSSSGTFTTQLIIFVYGVHIYCNTEKYQNKIRKYT